MKSQHIKEHEKVIFNPIDAVGNTYADSSGQRQEYGLSAASLPIGQEFIILISKEK